MVSSPELIFVVLAPFADMFSKPVWQHVQVLLTGAIICNGPRTVASILRAVGLGDEKRFEKYHRVLNRAKWSSLNGSKILLGLLIKLLPPHFPFIILVDETIERRNGKKIKAKGVYRDAVRSSEAEVVKCFGLKWIAMMLVVPLPWCKRPWALPFLAVLAPSKAANEKAKKRHKTTIDWATQMVLAVSSWLGQRPWILVGDGAYACVNFALACKKKGCTLISRLRLDSRLFEFPGPVQPGKRGPKPKKGAKLPSLKSMADAKEKQNWLTIEVSWYGGEIKLLNVLTGTCLWHTPGEAPVPIRWVLVSDPKGKVEAFFSTDLTMDPKRVIELFVLRWSVEVTFEEARRHLGMETQRQWSDKAIARTTPAILAMFSIISLVAFRLVETIEMPLRSSAWYSKEEATFSDVLAFVRRSIWAEKYLVRSAIQGDRVLFSRQEWEGLLDQLAAVA